MRASELQNKPTVMLVVAVALEGCDGVWLMHRRPQGKQHAGLWEFPGGKVESHEIPRAALVREIKEELGIALCEDEIVSVGFAESNGAESTPPIVILLYRTSVWEGEPAALEGGAVGWFTPEEIARLDRPPLDRALSRKLFA